MIYRLCLLITCIILLAKGLAQNNSVDTSAFRIIAGGPQYEKPNFYQWLWGRNRRKEWTTPIRVRVLWLEKEYGGLMPYKIGGGNESKTLRLKTTDGKEYTLRSINKSRNDVVLPVYKGTIIEDIINDGVSMSHPYAALAVTGSEKNAGIYHTNPEIVYVPRQQALDTFNTKFGDDLYLFEQRLDGDWSEADNLGNFKSFLSTDDVIDSLLETNSHKADQRAFAKVRLFDMLIADWDRHEDNWQWGPGDISGTTLYQPIPRDRDQAFYTHNGFLIDRFLPASGLGFMQNFDYEVEDIATLNAEERNMDRFFTNELDLDDWLDAAKALQQSLADSIIELSIQQLPPEIFSISGAELIDKLKSRRDQLPDFTKEYYLFLAQEVEITGSREREVFDIKKINNGDISVNIFSINKNGTICDTAFYSRLIKPTETKEIRIYGLAGEDKYVIAGNINPIKVRIIGGPDKDSVAESSDAARFHVYDDHNNVFLTRSGKLHLSDDSAIHVFKYAAYDYDKKGFTSSASYNLEDRLYVGLGYGFTNYKWRREPFATKQFIGLNYSISQTAISATYSALFPRIFGGWDLSLFGNYDAERWTNFFGLGNETIVTTREKEYNRLRSEEWSASAMVHRQFGKSTVFVSAFFQHAEILHDSERYISKIFAQLDSDVFQTNNYTGPQFTYTFLKLNDSIVPTKGVTFLATGSYVWNVSESEFFQKYNAKLRFYLPLSDKFSLAVKTGATTIVGNDNIINSAQFYEHAVIGGPDNLKGVRRERFWGKASFYNSNELRFITNVRTRLLNAKAGLFAFFDNGRVWVPGEESQTLHTGFGVGMLLAPFNTISGSITYGVSKDYGIVQLGLNKLF